MLVSFSVFWVLKVFLGVLGVFECFGVLKSVLGVLSVLGVY